MNAAPKTSVLEQRIYHVTHIHNLPGIVAAGAITPNANPVVDIAPESLRLERMEGTVGGGSERPLDEFVPFFLSPDARLWHALRTATEHPRLSRDALVSDASEYVFLVSTVRTLVDASREFIVADDNSEGTHTTFAATREDSDRMLARLRTDAGDSILDAELLLHGSLPLELVTLVGVQNDKVRSAVREILEAADFSPKVAVYPPWFVTES